MAGRLWFMNIQWLISMSENNLRETFDKAYSYLNAGNIKEAAVCFEYIVENPQVFGAQATRIAQRCILWYCIPLDVIFFELEQHKYPVDVHSIIQDLYRMDTRYTETNIEPILKAIEDYLAKNPDYIRVGKKHWIYQAVIVKLATRVVLDLVDTTTPISLESIFQKEWPDYCRDHPTFLDEYSEAALAKIFQNYNVVIIANKFVVSEQLLPYSLDSFARMINEADQPLCLEMQAKILFPDIYPLPEAIPILSEYLGLHLDNRFLEYKKGWYLIRSQFQFDTMSFDDLFANGNEPLTTNQLLNHRFPDLNINLFSQTIKTLIQSQLLDNTQIISIGTNSWISRTQCEAIQKQVIQILSNHERFIPFDNLLQSIAPPGIPQDSLKHFKNIILIALQASQQAIQVTNTYWMYRGKIDSVIDEIYFTLLKGKPAPLDKIVPTILREMGLSTPIGTFYDALEQNLRSDKRFESVADQQRLWRAIRIGQRDNTMLFRFLSQYNFPMTKEEISSKHQQIDLEYDFESDERSQAFPGNRWGLSSWICLNDYVYEYLLRKKQHLHEITVTGYVCREIGYKGKSAFFFPNDDPRFAQDELNRWYCRYELTANDLNRLLKVLDQYGGSGRKLELLFREIIHLPPDATNAYEVLPNDSRFIQLDDFWYSRKEAFRILSSEDIENIYDNLSGLPTDSPAVSTKDIGMSALDWDGRLSNVAELLALDDRFIEIYKGFWILSTWSSPDYDRTAQGGIAVFGSTHVSEIDDDSSPEIPTSLTKRSTRNAPKIPAVEQQVKCYHTLSNLDVLHGNIRIIGLLKKWIPETAETILLVDDVNIEMVAYIDETHTILNIRDWINRRALTYGDKISIQPGRTKGRLFIRPYGKRDERVYQEAIQHQNIEGLIEEARRVNKTYHDLMVDVMVALDIPLHREDIFQLVDYQRTAVRNTIFEILSLTDCPYEELRYFVPKGRGYWSFDQRKKRAFDMKMTELLAENAALKGQIAQFSERNESEQDITAGQAQLEQKIQSLEQSIRVLTNEKSELSIKNQTLDAEKSKGESDYYQLMNNLTQVQKSLLELTDVHKSTLTEVDNLRQEQQLFRDKEPQHQNAQAELEKLHIEQKDLQEKASQVLELQAELKQSRQLLAQIQAEAARQETTHQDQVSSMNSEVDTLRGELQQVKTALAESNKQSADVFNGRTKLQEEFDSHQMQTQGEISALQDQLIKITAQVTELTGQLQLSTGQLDTERDENNALKTQLDITGQQFKSYTVKVEQELAVLNNQIQKTTTELEARTATIQTLEAQLITGNTEKAAIQEDDSAKQAQLSQQIVALQSQVDTLNQMHTRQIQDLAALEARLKLVDRALATPLGRLFALLQGLK